MVGQIRLEGYARGLVAPHTLLACPDWKFASAQVEIRELFAAAVHVFCRPGWQGKAYANFAFEKGIARHNSCPRNMNHKPAFDNFRAYGNRPSSAFGPETDQLAICIEIPLSKRIEFANLILDIEIAVVHRNPRFTPPHEQKRG